METIPRRSFTKQRKKLLQANDKLYEGTELPTKTSDLPLNTEIIKQEHGLMMEDQKIVVVGEYRKSPVFAGYHTFAPAGHIERYMEDAVFRFRGTKKMIQLWPLQIRVETLSISIHLKLETEEFVT